MWHAKTWNMQRCLIMVIAKSKWVEWYYTVIAAINKPAVGRFVKGCGFIIENLLVQCAQWRESRMGLLGLLHVSKTMVGACPHASFSVNGYAVHIVWGKSVGRSINVCLACCDIEKHQTATVCRQPEVVFILWTNKINVAIAPYSVALGIIE